MRLMVESDVEDEERKEQRLGGMLCVQEAWGNKGYKW